jgi:type II secretory pathway predicted ATPase ExeA
VVTGTEGVGKTTLWQMLARFDPGRRAVRCIEAHEIDDALLRPSSEARRPVLAIDDADRLGDARLRTLLGSTCERAGDPAVNMPQLVLIGRPALVDLVGALTPGAVSYELRPLSPDEIGNYIERRLWIARRGLAWGGGAGPRFGRAALAAIARASEGNPRVVNLICERALQIAAERGKVRVNRSIVRLAAAYLSPPDPRPRVWGAAATKATVIVMALVALLFVASALFLASSLPTVERPPRVNTEATPAPTAPSASAPDFRADVLARASTLAMKPDVRGLMRLQEEVRSRQASTPEQPGLVELLVELEELTNQARERQLELDRGRLLGEERR